MRRLGFVVAATALLAGQAVAYEPARTHAGLTQRAAAASGLQAVLSSRIGRALGLYDTLALGNDPAVASLTARLALLDPAQSYVPDAQGRATALSWLAAGSVLEEIPGALGLRHFLDPATGAGLDNSGALGLFARIQLVLDRGGPFWQAIAGREPALSGESSLEWLSAPDNDLGITAYLAHREKAATAAEPAARDAELAQALVCAGAIAHLLEDAGEPSHVRNDFAVAHLEGRPGGLAGRLSPYENFVGQTLGTLGLPPPAAVWRRTHLVDFFRTGHAEGDDRGLADETAARFFSDGTLPSTITLTGSESPAALQALVQGALDRPSPDPGPLDLAAAGQPAGAYLAQDGIGALVAYRVLPGGAVQFTLDDTTDAAYAAVLLPEVEGATAGLLDFLFRGDLRFAARPDGGVSIQNGSLGLAKGTLHVLWDDSAGHRTELPLAGPVTWPAAPGAGLGAVATLPAGAKRLVAELTGTDEAGEPVVIEEDALLPLALSGSAPSSAPAQ